ncbi:hypothetical protein M0802_000814 [Mischocyttarus mexicanus]|nr:hypothetical protein M0802_000814 [Mischocyttarus mexicanus]
MLPGWLSRRAAGLQEKRQDERTNERAKDNEQVSWSWQFLVIRPNISMDPIFLDTLYLLAVVKSNQSFLARNKHKNNIFL